MKSFGPTAQISPTRARIVVDCFKFSNEFERLKLRLNILNDIADWFVLVEATMSHSGDPKPLFFEQNKKIFGPWLDRIRHVVVDDMPRNVPSNYDRDRFQMDAIMRGLPELRSNDTLIISDLDEIPNPSVIRLYKPSHGIMGLKCYNSIFYLNVENYTVSWCNPKILNAEIIKRVTPTGIRDYWAAGWGHYFHAGGWHFSYCGGLEEFQYKITHYSHAGQPPSSWHDRALMKWILEDPVPRAPEYFTTAMRLRPIDRSFPQYVIDHEQELIGKGLIWQPSKLP